MVSQVWSWFQNWALGTFLDNLTNINKVSIKSQCYTAANGVSVRRGVSVRGGSLSGGDLCQEGVSVRGGSLSGGGLCQEGVSVRRGFSVGGVFCQGSLSGQTPPYGGRADGNHPTGMLSCLKNNLFTSTQPQILCAWGHKIYLCFASGDHMVEKSFATTRMYSFT